MALLALVLGAAGVVLAQAGTAYDLHWNVVSAGGGVASGSTYRLNYSLGQPLTVGQSTGSRYQLGQGYWQGSGFPTAVRITRLDAWAAGRAIHIEWETASEVDNAGFNLYRGPTASGPFARLNEALIPSQAPGSPGGAIYTWEDSGVEPATPYYYEVEDIDIRGVATLHGPVWATAAHALYLPLVLR
jgi:hypothetical protein